MAKLGKDAKFIIADKLANAFKPSLGNNFSDLDDHVQFGILLNKRFISKGKETSLNKRYGFETASHITNLVRRRVTGFNNSPVEVDL